MSDVIGDTIRNDPRVVRALLGKRNNIHWADAPADASYPLVVLQKVSERHSVTLDGDDGLARLLVQMDVYATHHGDMRRVGTALRKLWSGYRSEPIAGAFVQGIRETVEHDKAGELFYRAHIDIFIIIKETNDD